MLLDPKAEQSREEQYRRVVAMFRRKKPEDIRAFRIVEPNCSRNSKCVLYVDHCRINRPLVIRVESNREIYDHLVSKLKGALGDRTWILRANSAAADAEIYGRFDALMRRALQLEKRHNERIAQHRPAYSGPVHLRRP